MMVVASVSLLVCHLLGFANTNLGMVARWANVKVAVVRGPVDMYWFAIGCENSLVEVDVGLKGPLGRVSVL